MNDLINTESAIAETKINQIIAGDGVNADLPIGWYAVLETENPTVEDFYCEASFYKHIGNGEWAEEEGDDVEYIRGRPINCCSYIAQN